MIPHKIKFGAKGQQVRWVQDRLCKHGYFTAVDGVFWAKTLAAVKRFQSAKHLIPDGVVGPKTQAFLRQRKGHEPSKATSPVKHLPKPRPAATTSSIGERAVATMESWVGLSEQPAGGNKVPKLARLAKRVGWTRGVANMGFSWCDFGVHLALAIAGCKTLVASGSWSGYTGMYVPATRTELERLVKIGRAERVPKSMIRRGDIVIMFEEGHIGFARAKSKSKRTVPTIECNTSPGSGDQTNGDGCYRKVRNLTTEVDAAYRLWR